LREIEFILAKSRLMEGVRGALNASQENALLRMFAAGPEGFSGGMSAANYTRITTAPPATATRDLAELATIAASTRTGERKGARYHLKVALAPVASVEIDEILLREQMLSGSNGSDPPRSRSGW
jgi:hypothetical protein